MSTKEERAAEVLRVAQRHSDEHAKADQRHAEEKKHCARRGAGSTQLVTQRNRLRTAP